MALSTTEGNREIIRNFYRNRTPKVGFDESEYAYQWEYRGCDGIYMWQSQSLGWETVKNDMPENPQLRDPSGYCVLADTVLMRMPRENYAELQTVRKAIVGEQRGERSREEITADIDEKVSRLVGHNINVSFRFNDQRELATRKAG